eukprot:c38871_g1_i1 orf=52-267(+)
MNFPDQRYLGLFLLEMRRNKEVLIRGSSTGQVQRQLTDFFRHVTSPSQTLAVSTLMAASKEVTHDQAIQLG